MAGMRESAKGQNRHTGRDWISPAERFPFGWAGLVLAAAAALRLAGAGHDLWLDEIWSVFITTQIHSLWQVFTLHHEINHHLNTLWLGLWGPGAPPVLYHAWSLACGTAAVAAAGWIGWRRGRAGALFAMVLTGFSYLLIAYSAEARGYASLALFLLLSYGLLDAHLRRPRFWTAALYAVCAVLGLLSQPVYVAFLGAAPLWGVFRLRRAGKPWRRIAGEILACQAIPLAALAGLYALDYRYVVAGGGTPNQDLLAAFGTSLAWALGSPANGLVQFVCAVAALAGLGAGIHLHVREGSDRWVFFVFVTLVFPPALLLLRHSEWIYTRHFIVAAVFLLVLWGEVLADLWRRGGPARVVAGLVLAVFVACNGWHVADWVVHGRGQAAGLVRYIAGQAAGGSVTVGGDKDFRVGLVVDYYRLSLPEAKAVRYLQRNNWPAAGPDYLITHAESWKSVKNPPPVLPGPRGTRYRWVQTFPTAPLSGLHLCVYRNEGFVPFKVGEEIVGGGER